MRQYLDALKFVLDTGVDKPNRTGVDTRAVFGLQMRFDLAEDFPAITTKKLAFKTLAKELLWFISGSTSVRKLQAQNVHIWDDDYERWQLQGRAKSDGDLGRIYGAQWRSWQSPDGRVIDQLKEIIEKIRTNPNDRRLIVTAWNPGELDQMALPPCHALFQFFVAGDKLSLQMYQRSCDMFLGVPFNIASYALLLGMVAQVTGLRPGEFIHVLGDTHIYHNHFDQAREQLTRSPLPLPQLRLNPAIKDIDGFRLEDIELVNYQHHDAIKADLNVGLPSKTEPSSTS